MMKSRKIGALFLTLFLGLSAWATPLPPVRILSIDGGGIRGLIPAIVLDRLEKELQRPVVEIFDMVVGSSSGAITAMSLAAPGANQQPRFSAEEVVRLYRINANKIFSASLEHQIKTAGGLLGPKYDSVGLREVMRTYLRDITMKEALVPMVITGYHIGGRTGVEFSSIDAQRFPSDKNCKMADVAMATAAAPVYFDAVDIAYPWGVLRSVIDGGIYKNNPALIAYINAKELFPDREIIVFSLGTGQTSDEELDREFLGRGGLLHWIEPIIGHTQAGNSSADETFLHRSLNQGKEGVENFYRIDIDVAADHRKLDNIDPENLDYLYNRGVAATRTETFRRALERLKQILPQ